MKPKLGELHVSAVVSILGLVLMIYGSVQFYTKYLEYLDPANNQFEWEGGDVVQAIRQRAMTAGSYISGLHHALAIIGIGAVLQCALVYRLTRSIPAAVRALLQVELVYQAVTSHKVDDNDMDAKEKRAAAATVMNIGNYGIYFSWILNGLNITGMSVFQRPLRYTIVARDLVTVWTSVGMVLTVLAAILASNHLAGAVWSVWYVKPKPTEKQLPQSSRSITATATSSELSSATVVIKDADVSPETGTSTQQRIKSVLRFLTCLLNIVAHISTMSIIALSIRGLISALAAGRFVLCAVLFYAVTRVPVDSMFWGYLSGGLNLVFNRSTHKKAWWVSIVWAILHSGTGIVCGSLQASMYLFTRRYTRANIALFGRQYTANVTTSAPLAVERNVGIFVACMAAADLLVYLVLVLLHLRTDADTFESNIQMLSMPEA